MRKMAVGLRLVAGVFLFAVGLQAADYRGVFHVTSTSSTLTALIGPGGTYNFGPIGTSSQITSEIVNLKNNFTEINPAPTASTKALADLYRTVVGGGTLYFTSTASGTGKIVNSNQAVVGEFTITVVSSGSGESTKYSYKLTWEP